MEIEGRIVGREEDVAQVMIVRSSACGHDCETCGACAGKEHVMLAVDKARYPIGTDVTVRVSDRVPLGTAFIVYVLPILLCFVLWAICSSWLNRGWIGWLIGLFVWVVLLYYMNRKKGRNGIDGTVIGIRK